MPPIVNRYTRLVGIDHPIVQEGLGPFRTPKLAAAVSNAGGLGTVSMPGMPADISAGARTFRQHIEECAALTDRPFAVNIPVGVDASGAVLPFTDTYIRAALAARESDPAIAARLTVLTTSAGFPGGYVGLIKDAGLVHQHKAGSTRQAVKAAQAGVDVVIAAGFEMGGHAPSKAVHTFVLIPSVTEAVDIPVLLTGGARDGRGLAAALAMGADGVAMGTRFILSHDNSDWHPASSGPGRLAGGDQGEGRMAAQPGQAAAAAGRDVRDRDAQGGADLGVRLARDRGEQGDQLLVAGRQVGVGREQRGVP
jgi:enoyl-[acyl-carrier protein] reductase II